MATFFFRFFLRWQTILRDHGQRCLSRTLEEQNRDKEAREFIKHVNDYGKIRSSLCRNKETLFKSTRDMGSGVSIEIKAQLSIERTS